jgi:deoxyribose-phosphate aldolase
MIPAQAAARALPLLDLTSLEADDDETRIAALCRRATTRFGPVAAVCIHAPFVALARRMLPSGIAVATVANFPHGTGALADVLGEIEGALGDGADEIDVVLPYPAFLAGDRDRPSVLLRAARKATQGRARLKVILETGALAAPAVIRSAAEIAIAAGADFLKTSTGKRQPAATPEAARILLETIAASGRAIGCKVAGGVRTTEDAARYLALADTIMGPAWAGRETFRFGASALLDDLLRALGDEPGRASGEQRY